MSIIDFLENKKPNIDGLMFNDILNFTDKELEEKHSFIQWVFPITEKSKFNLTAPVLTDNDIALIKNSQEAKDNILKMFSRMLIFYGFKLNDDIVFIDPAFELKSKNWITPYNHNFLRITRILKCLCLIDYKEYAKSFIQQLASLRDIDYTTYGFWFSVLIYN